MNNVGCCCFKINVTTFEWKCTPENDLSEDNVLSLVSISFMDKPQTY